MWTGAENLAPLRFDLRTVQLVGGRYTDWAIPAHSFHCTFILFFWDVKQCTLEEIYRHFEEQNLPASPFFYLALTHTHTHTHTHNSFSTLCWNPLYSLQTVSTSISRRRERLFLYSYINLLKPVGHVMQHQFNIQQLYSPSTLHLCVLYLSENKQRLVPLTA